MHWWLKPDLPLFFSFLSCTHYNVIDDTHINPVCNVCCSTFHVFPLRVLFSDFWGANRKSLKNNFHRLTSLSRVNEGKHSEELEFPCILFHFLYIISPIHLKHSLEVALWMQCKQKSKQLNILPTNADTVRTSCILFYKPLFGCRKKHCFPTASTGSSRVSYWLYWKNGSHTIVSSVVPRLSRSKHRVFVRTNLEIVSFYAKTNWHTNVKESGLVCAKKKKTKRKSIVFLFL